MSLQRISISFFAGLVVSTAALAHPTLVASVPAAESEGAAPERIELTFDEKLAAQSSAARLVMTAMPGMSDHPPMAVGVTVSAGENPHAMLLTPRQPLPAGTYRVDWRAVSSDAHPVNGQVTFKVK